MFYLITKTAVSAVVIVLVSEIAKRSPAFGALVASLPLISVLGMVWLWNDIGDKIRLAEHSQATFWYVLPSLPMFLLIPLFLRLGAPFWAALATGVVLTAVLYLLMTAMLARYGISL